MGLDGTEFESLSALVETDVGDWSRCPKTSALVERLFNFARCPCTAKAKKMSVERLQHSCAISGLDVLHDRPLTPPSCSTKVHAPTRIEPAAFVAKSNHSFSLGDEFLEDFIENAESEYNNDVFLQSGLRWMALQSSHPDFIGTQEFWKSRNGGC